MAEPSMVAEAAWLDSSQMSTLTDRRLVPLYVSVALRTSLLRNSMRT